jgi:hypothetical protein
MECYASLERLNEPNDARKIISEHLGAGVDRLLLVTRSPRMTFERYAHGLASSEINAEPTLHHLNTRLQHISSSNLISIVNLRSISEYRGGCQSVPEQARFRTHVEAHLRCFRC